MIYALPAPEITDIYIYILGKTFLVMTFAE